MIALIPSAVSTSKIWKGLPSGCAWQSSVVKQEKRLRFYHGAKVWLTAHLIVENPAKISVKNMQLIIDAAERYTACRGYRELTS